MTLGGLRFYYILSRLLAPLWHWHFRMRLKRGKEDAQRFQERLGISSVNRLPGQLVWLHGASVGESLSAIPLIKELLTHNPKLHILLTTGTLSSAQMLQECLPAGVIHQFLPIDTPQAVERFLHHWQPNLILWFESELWPNFLMTIKSKKIPCVLINGRLSDRSFKRWLYWRGTLSQLLSSFLTVYAQSDEQAQRFLQFGAKHVKVLHNLKFSASPLEYDQEAVAALQEQIRSRPVWLAASTRSGEEESVLQTHLGLQALLPNLLTVIAPRHPHRGADIGTLCEQHHLSFQQRSQEPILGKGSQIYIADTLGELGLFYMLCPIVFVGGSLVPVGGHNIIEPAHFRCAIIQGPLTHNFRETTQRFLAHHAIREVQLGIDLLEAVASLFQSPTLRQTYGNAAYDVATSPHQGLCLLMTDIETILRGGTSH